ncbi:flavodoxin family protein [Vallitalea okinawensis]|uniref:flavodoxin family protein n=1 Tax=Vallitalea okinawensis TaxID=2078660 RepID=UPI00130094CF|nr:flavodoxin family protein [Vallitalea okinawensis]
MRILMINSSRQKGNTIKVLDLIQEEIAASGHQVELINLTQYNIKRCIGCEKCIFTDACILHDDMSLLMEKLEQADGIVLSSPVFMGQVTGLMKSFFDRTCKWFHRPVLVGKPAIVVSTTAASGLKNTTQYMKEVCDQWGLAHLGVIKKTYKDIPYQLSNNEKDLIKGFLSFNREKYQPSMAQLIQYQVQKVLALKVMKIDKDFWESRGWHQQIYYYSCQINFSKKIAANWFYKMLYRKVNPVQD